MGKLESVVEKLQEYRDVTKEIISNACHGALLAKGFIVDETLTEQPDKGSKTFEIYSIF